MDREQMKGTEARVNEHDHRSVEFIQLKNKEKRTEGMSSGTLGTNENIWVM